MLPYSANGRLTIGGDLGRGHSHSMMTDEDFLIPADNIRLPEAITIKHVRRVSCLDFSWPLTTWRDRLGSV